jgi:CO/xanthine dehydrogenase FAD-binding subunit
MMSSSPTLLGRHVPLLAHAAAQVGDPQIRHRGTIGGSLAHADPASDLPAALLALGATVVARGSGRRAGNRYRGVLPGPVRDRARRRTSC